MNQCKENRNTSQKNREKNSSVQATLILKAANDMMGGTDVAKNLSKLNKTNVSRDSDDGKNDDDEPTNMDNSDDESY